MRGQGRVGGLRVPSDRAEGDQAAFGDGLRFGGGQFVAVAAQDRQVPHGRGGPGEDAPQCLLEEVVRWAGDVGQRPAGQLGGA